jgi:hypothetical protein
MPSPAVWKYCAQQRFRIIAEEVGSVAIALLSHPIDNMKSIDSPNGGQHELLCPDSLLDRLRDLVALHFRKCRNSKVNQLSVFVTNLRNLRFSWASRMASNSRQVFPSEGIGNCPFTGAGSNVNKEISSEAIPGNHAIYSNGKLTGYQ